MSHGTAEAGYKCAEPAFPLIFGIAGVAGRVLTPKSKMKNVLKESEHLVRLVVVLALGIATFLMIRYFVVPPTFEQYGHYRGASLGEIRARPISFAGQAACAVCHDDIAQKRSQGKHAKVACEACHGPLAQHADDPDGHKARKPDVATLCVRCHEADPAKPKGFPQVDSKDHAQGALCNTCHDPHRPNM